MIATFVNVEFLIGDIVYSVDFEFQPFERQTLLEPGCAASVSIEGAYVDGDECTLDEEDLKELEIAALEYAVTYNS